jgi:hypothetical protein
MSGICFTYRFYVLLDLTQRTQFAIYSIFAHLHDFHFLRRLEMHFEFRQIFGLYRPHSFVHSCIYYLQTLLRRIRWLWLVSDFISCNNSLDDNALSIPIEWINYYQLVIGFTMAAQFLGSRYCNMFRRYRHIF